LGVELRAQVVFDLSKLDPLASNLDLGFFAAHQVQGSILWVVFDEITGLQ
jgi:hypothetical protein